MPTDSATPPASHARPAVCGRVVVIRSRLAVVRLTKQGGHEYDIDIPVVFLPEGVDRGDRLSFEISKTEAKKADG